MNRRVSTHQSQAEGPTAHLANVHTDLLGQRGPQLAHTTILGHGQLQLGKPPRVSPHSLSRTHTQRGSGGEKDTYPHIHTGTQWKAKFAHTRTHTHMHTRTRTHAHTHARTHSRTRTHTRTHTHMHARTRMHAHHHHHHQQQQQHPSPSQIQAQPGAARPRG
jgi:hypothetical protein